MLIALVSLVLLSCAPFGTYALPRTGSCADVDCLYTRRIVGQLHTKDFAIYMDGRDGLAVSLFHDIPLQPAAQNNGSVYNMIVEIPRWGISKLEINKETVMNPIKQDVSDNGELRYLPNIYPYTGYPVNYGAFPQTWEDPTFTTPETGTKGDNDPIDVLDIGQREGEQGEIKQVKILGGLALIDTGETDWKVVTIDIRDPLVDKLNDIGDVENYFPGYLDGIREWFAVYKLMETGKRNTFGFNGQYQSKDYMEGIVKETNEFWKALVNGKQTDKGDIKTVNREVKSSPYMVGPNDPAVRNISPGQDQPPAPLDPSDLEWTFIGGAPSQ
ncbi:hypothetical protein VTP01DRAFT_2853 [Rhizomucor pusillus]|uniref:uncharacterized protein n=1 Tax=Rhizomucor pusillus TaxID=4840 RepID=UPI0037442C47